MKPECKDVRVISNKEISKGIFRLAVECDDNFNAGQFYMLKAKGQTFLKRPISVCEKEDSKLIFVYAVVGKGTEDISSLKENDTISITGPHGNGFDIHKAYGKAAIVSGGIGIAPMLGLAKNLRNINKYEEIDLYSGFRDDIYLIDEMEKYVNSINISTDTGKNGVKGFVTDLLKPEEYDTVLCCGPEIMMKKVIDMCKAKNVKVYVSMEKHMACGIGACLVCTCKTKDGNKRACKDGPVFDGYDVEL
ncbi:dihydroorotate dehydrogenase electron transfer subunit [Clostridium sp. BJN0001]|uniref:dihydroorotate dehydrogenase electron transfer subunit n=1 Tax=Clostridium sp. BJN0001 TaxID=2930219 RepID=UPI001FD19390|nr:dihydroorotate dehydrogenase electron transfer subunit [Clostridium sp. BJN0001]